MRCRREYWNKRALDFSAPHGRLHLIARVIDRVRRHTHGPLTVLDVGCGGAALRGLLPPEAEYFGVDLAVRVVAGRLDSEHFEAVDLEDATTPCFGGRRFDVVVCSGVVEYVRRLDRLFAFVRRAIRPDGHLLLTYLNHSHYLDVLLHKRYKDPHVNFMPIVDFVRYVRAHGFRIEQDTSLTVSDVELPLLAHFQRLPLSLWNRNYLFVCRPEVN